MRVDVRAAQYNDNYVHPKGNGALSLETPLSGTVTMHLHVHHPINDEYKMYYLNMKILTPANFSSQLILFNFFFF